MILTCLFRVLSSSWNANSWENWQWISSCFAKTFSADIHKRKFQRNKKKVEADLSVPPLHTYQYLDIKLQLWHHSLDHLSENVDWHNVFGMQDTRCFCNYASNLKMKSDRIHNINVIIVLSILSTFSGSTIDKIIIFQKSNENEDIRTTIQQKLKEKHKLVGSRLHTPFA